MNEIKHPNDEAKAKKIAKETLDVLEDGFTTERRFHNGWIEYENAKKKYDIMPFKLMFGKYQYIFTKGNMRISLVKLNDSPLTGTMDKWYWEIYAYENKRLFTDVRKFPSKEAAMKAVKSILGD